MLLFSVQLSENINIHFTMLEDKENQQSHLTEKNFRVYLKLNWLFH